MRISIRADINVSSRRRAEHGSIESNGTCYIEKVPRECEIRRVRSGEGGEKRDKEKERNVVWPVSSSARGVLSQWERIPMMMTKVTSARRMALRV